MREQRSLHCPADHAATKQKSVNFAYFAFIVDNGNAHQAMISEAVPDSNRKHLPSGPGRQFGDLLLGIAPGGYIELIGLLSELRDSCQRRGQSRCDLRFLLKKTVEVFLRLEVRRGPAPARRDCHREKPGYRCRY